MLQTTENQLTLKQIVSKHRQLIINLFIDAGYRDIIKALNYEYDKDIVMYDADNPIGLDLYADAFNQERLMFENDENIFYRTCNRFTTKDIIALADLYIDMLKNNSHKIPYIIEEQNVKYIEPGQLSAIIAKYLNERRKTNATNH